MSAIDDLQPDQRAVLQLVLRQGRSYDQLSGMLGIERDAVGARAHAGLEALAPDAARRLSPERRAEIADYLLRQQDPGQEDATREYIAGSASARAFARLLADALAPIARDPLPEIPAASPGGPSAEPPPAPPGPAPTPVAPQPPTERFTREPGGDVDTVPPVAAPPPAPAAAATGLARARSSRLGGVIILVALGILVAVAVILIVNNNNGSSDSGATSTPTTASTAPSNSTPQTTATTPVTPKFQINLRPLQSGSKAVGLAQVVTQGNQEAIALAAQGVAPNNHNAYVVWLYNGPSDSKFLGFVQSAVGSNGQFTALIPPSSLPSDAKSFKYLLISLEPVTSSQKNPPAKPTQLILRGRLRL